MYSIQVSLETVVGVSVVSKDKQGESEHSVSILFSSPIA